MENSKQAKIDRMFKRAGNIAPYESDMKEHKDREHALVILIAACGTLPFTIVDNPHFRAFCNVMDPRFNVPHSRRLRNLIIEHSNTIRNQIKLRLANTTLFATTCDSATSRANDSFTTVTSHFIDTSWNLQHFALFNVAFCGSHTLDNLRELVIRNIDEYGLNVSTKAITFVTDYAANLRGAVSELGIVKTGCQIHKSNTVLKKALDSRAGATSPLVVLVKQVLALVAEIRSHLRLFKPCELHSRVQPS
jgi:hypothetical protein